MADKASAASRNLEKVTKTSLGYWLCLLSHKHVTKTFWDTWFEAMMGQPPAHNTAWRNRSEKAGQHCMLGLRSGQRASPAQETPGLWGCPEPQHPTPSTQQQTPSTQHPAPSTQHQGGGLGQQERSACRTGNGLSCFHFHVDSWYYFFDLFNDRSIVSDLSFSCSLEPQVNYNSIN